MTVFNQSLERLKQDPRITVRLGNDITGRDQHNEKCLLCNTSSTW